MILLAQFSRLALLSLCVAGGGAVARADVKIKTRSNSGGQTTESVTYIKGKRQRAEYGPAVTITQCDLRRTLQLAVPSKTYTVTPFGGGSASGAAASAAGQPQTSRRGGVVTTTISATDTGERKTLFGYAARRIKTTIVTESSPDSCSPVRSRMETDGWYIDAAFALDCDAPQFGSYAPQPRADGCRDEYRTKQTGTLKLGYPVLLTTTILGEAGQPSFTFTQEVIELSQATLDAALFDAPADFREVSSQQALYGAGDTAPSSASDDGEANAKVSAAGGTNANGDGIAAAEPSVYAAAGPKRAGVVRVGIAVTQATAAGNFTTETLAEAVRDALAKNITGPTVEVAALTSEFPQQVEDEARRKACDFILYVAATHKKGSGGGGFGGFLKKATTSTAGGAEGGTTRGFTSKDELTLEYGLQRAGAGAPPAMATLKAKARHDGDDIATQLARQAAAAVLAELNKM